MRMRRTGNYYPATCFDIIPKAMRNRRCIYVKVTVNWRVKWSVETGESDVDVLSRNTICLLAFSLGSLSLWDDAGGLTALCRMEKNKSR